MEMVKGVYSTLCLEGKKMTVISGDETECHPGKFLGCRIAAPRRAAARSRSGLHNWAAAALTHGQL